MSFPIAVLLSGGGTTLLRESREREAQDRAACVARPRGRRIVEELDAAAVGGGDLRDEGQAQAVAAWAGR